MHCIGGGFFSISVCALKLPLAVEAEPSELRTFYSSDLIFSFTFHFLPRRSSQPFFSLRSCPSFFSVRPFLIVRSPFFISPALPRVVLRSLFPLDFASLGDLPFTFVSAVSRFLPSLPIFPTKLFVEIVVFLYAVWSDLSLFASLVDIEVAPFYLLPSLKNSLSPSSPHRALSLSPTHLARFLPCFGYPRPDAAICPSRHCGARFQRPLKNRHSRPLRSFS